MMTNESIFIAARRCGKTRMTTAMLWREIMHRIEIEDTDNQDVGIVVRHLLHAGIGEPYDRNAYLLEQANNRQAMQDDSDLSARMGGRYVR